VLALRDTVTERPWTPNPLTLSSPWARQRLMDYSEERSDEESAVLRSVATKDLFPKW
jgi:hypothetical protein